MKAGVFFITLEILILMLVLQWMGGCMTKRVREGALGWWPISFRQFDAGRVTWCGWSGIGVTWGVWKPVKSTSKLRYDKTIPCQVTMLWALNLEVEIRALILGLCACVTHYNRL